MSLGIRLNGVSYTNFISAGISFDIGSVLTPFRFVASANQDALLPIASGDIVDVLADGLKIASGRVENIGVTYDHQEHTITISGRGALVDFVDSSVGTIKEFTGQVNLVDIIRLVLDGIGLTSVQIKNNAGEIKSFAAEDITSATVGMTCFDFCEKFSRKRQVLMTTDGVDLILARTGTTSFPGSLKQVIGADDNNILAATFSFSSAELFHTYQVQSQLNPIGLLAGLASDVSDQNGTAIDEKIPKTRRLEFSAEESSDSFTATDRAKWEANIRRAKALTYRPKFQGHTLNDKVIMPNKLLFCVDDFVKISATLLIKRVDLRYDLQSGSLTELELTYKDAYSLQVEQDSRKTDKVGVGLL